MDQRFSRIERARSADPDVFQIRAAQLSMALRRGFVSVDEASFLAMLGCKEAIALYPETEDSLDFKELVAASPELGFRFCLGIQKWSAKLMVELAEKVYQVNQSYNCRDLGDIHYFASLPGELLGSWMYVHTRLPAVDEWLKDRTPKNRAKMRSHLDDCAGSTSMNWVMDRSDVPNKNFKMSDAQLVLFHDRWTELNKRAGNRVHRFLSFMGRLKDVKHLADSIYERIGENPHRLPNLLMNLSIGLLRIAIEDVSEEICNFLISPIVNGGDSLSLRLDFSRRANYKNIFFHPLKI